jgi:DNA-binding HxlR family transcriptional regulator
MANYRLYAVVFFKTLHLQSSFAGTTISCLQSKQPQEVHKSVRWLNRPVLSQGLTELEQCMVIQKTRSDGYRVRLSWGITWEIPTH